MVDSWFDEWEAIAAMIRRAARRVDNSIDLKIYQLHESKVFGA
jgi:hypothetical protein